MTKPLDYIMAGVPAAYFLDKLIREKNETLTRLVLGTATGIAAAYTLPEIYDSSKDKLTKDLGPDERKKALYMIGGAVAGTLIGYGVHNQYKTNPNTPKQNPTSTQTPTP